MNIELGLDFDKCANKEKCESIITAGLTGDPVFNNEPGSNREYAICTVPVSVEKLIQQLKQTHKGNVLREIRKAEEKGYVSHSFNYFNHIDDIVEIHRSKTERGGKRMSTFYTTSRTHFGPKISELHPLEHDVCDYHNILYWGLFEPVASNLKNPDLNTEILTAYIRAFRLNDVIWYNMIIGHGDHLKYGVMHQLHTDFLKHLIAEKESPRYINYGAGGVENNPWKRRALFRNMKVRFDDLVNYYRPFDESKRKELKKRIHSHISASEYTHAEILVRLLRYYPDHSLKARLVSKLRRAVGT